MRSETPRLTDKNLGQARKILFAITDLLDKESIPYHLEGGTLLGIVRDKELLPWDHDIDLSTPDRFACAILKLRIKLLMSGYKISVRRSDKDFGPIKRGQPIIIKVKPLLGYVMRWFVPSYKSFVVLDLFLKTSDDTHTYWQAQNRVMRVENKFYQSYETVEYQNRKLRAPNHFCDFLTRKYGDWSVPVKEWQCGMHESTIVH